MSQVERSAGIVLLVLASALNAGAATAQKRYYAHEAVEDSHGVIAPWYRGQNGQVDFRVRIAAEFLKRYPWVGTDQCVMAGPHYIFNPRVDLDDRGTIRVLPASDQMNGNLGQRFKYITESLPRYYRYSGDPMVFGHLKIAADYLLENYQTPADHPWPRFPISVPLAGRPYGRAAPGGWIQLDLSAGIGLGMIRVYQMTGDRRYLGAAQHWGDVFAAKCNHQPGARPWGRYANPQDVPWGNTPSGNIQTGGVVSILIFLDELVRLGYTGRDGAILKARDAGRAYLRDTLLGAWHAWDTWGRHYWDWEHPVHGIVTTGWVSQYLMDHKDAFPNWRGDVRNILGIYLHHACVSPQSNGDVYSGAWAFPEGSSCCGRSLDFCPVFLSRYWARYAVEAHDERAREIARRMMILGTYHFRESGVVEDNIDGGQITAREWSELIGLGPILCGLEFMEWLPEIAAPSRENHLVRSGGTVTSIVYGKGRIEYTVFDAPAGGLDALRLAFRPTRVSAEGTPLSLRADLAQDGHTLRGLPDGDWIVTVRHDGMRSVVVEGNDPQEAAEVKGPTVVHRFDGNQARVIGRVDPAGGLADVYLDGVKQLVGVDCWTPGAVRQGRVLYYRNGLPNGPHELRVVARGQKNPYATGTNVFVDSVQWSAATGRHDFGSGGGPTGAQRMIFGYTGRKPYVDPTGKEWLPATEFVIRSGHHTDPVALAWRTKPVERPIEGTPDAELYRYGVRAPVFWANLTVGPGAYRVRLRLAETREPNDPKRKPMNIAINGQEVAKEIDIAARAGGFHKALDLTFEGIRPKNGIIEIRFTGTQGGEAILQALEVEPSR